MSSKSIRAVPFFVVAICLAFAYSIVDAQAQVPTDKTRPTVLQSEVITGNNVPSVANGVIYSQPPNDAFLQQQSSQIGYTRYGSDYDQYVWDDFTLSSTRVITEVGWRGVYNSGGSLGGAVSDFIVSVYTSTAANTQPDHLNGLLAQYTLGGNAGETPPWTSSGGTASTHDYTFTLPTSAPFTATAGIKYWVQIEGIQNGPTDWGIVAGTGGDGYHFYAIPGAGDFYFNRASGDAAFTLLGPVTASPIANAGQSQAVKSNALVTLDGSGSYDPDNDLPLSYGWLQTGGEAVILSSAVISRPTFTAPGAITQSGVLTFSLVVTDSMNLASAPAEVAVLVEPYSCFLPLVLR